MSTRGHIIKDPYFEINGVDLSSEVRQVEVQMTQPGVTSTASGADGQQRAPGLRDDAFVVRLRQKYGAGAVDATLWPIFDGQLDATVVVRESTVAAATANPEWQGIAFIESYPPFSQEVGQLAETTIRLPVQGKIERALS
jgi:hypothetical protein